MGFHVWRAATTSITTDEAFTYRSFVRPPLAQVLTTYDANHHVLNSLLMKASTSVFGSGELALRLPALLGTLLYLLCSWLLSRRLFGDTAFTFTLCALLGLYPGLVDLCSLARGYSLALGCLAWALIEVQKERWTGVSAALGLSIAANGVFAVPAGSLLLALLLRRRLWKQADALFVPGAVIAVVIMALPVSRASGSNFYYGADSVRASLESILGAPGWPTFSVVMMVTIPVLLAGAAWRERGEFAWTLAFCLAALVLLHTVVRVPWPLGRTGVYLLPLALLLIAQLIWDWRWAPALTGLAAVCCALTISPGAYPEWQFDADNREVASVLARDYPKARVAVQNPLWFGLGHYREVERFQPGAPADVYVFRTEEAIQRPPGLRVVRRFARSGLEIAVPE